MNIPFNNAERFFMAIFYKLFKASRIVLSLSLFLIACGQQAHADSLFTVEGVQADVTAENALAARQKAFEEAQAGAFKVLAERMLSEEELTSFQVPQGLQLSTLIQDYEVSNEKLSSKRYSAVYKFRFKDDSVRAFLSKNDMAYTDVSAKPMLILPFVDTGHGTLLWSEGNKWLQTWYNAPQVGSGLVPLIVPIGDLMDVSDIGDDEALTYDPRKLDAMLMRYNASEAVIALARAGEGGVLEVQIYRTDHQRPEYAHQILQLVLAGEDQSATYVAAVDKVKAALRSDWKEKTIVNYARAEGNSIQVRVRFSSLDEWSKLQRGLERVQGIKDIQIKALSPKEAIVELFYQGGLDRVTLSMQQMDMALELGQGAQQESGLYSRFMQPSAPPIYDLVYKRYGGTYNRDYYSRERNEEVPEVSNAGASEKHSGGSGDSFWAEF